MKLVAATTLFLSKLAISTENTNKYSSTCKDGMLEIHIPFANAKVSDLLKADAGDCPELKGNGGGPNDNHEYSHDSTAEKSILKINIENCGLNKVLDTYDTPKLRSGDGKYHMATANVTIGKKIGDDRELIFYNAILGAECGVKTDYTVSFNYAKTIDKHEETGCHANSPEGQCIIAAFDEYAFTFKEFNADFDTEITSPSHKANDMIHLQIQSNLPSDKTFAIDNCKFVDKISNPEWQVTDFENEYIYENYTMFNANTGDCKNDLIDLTVGLRNDVNDPYLAAAQISHRLFLLTKGDHDSYALECQIKVCDETDDSVCKTWKDKCEA